MRLRVVKLRQIFPFFGRVARFAAQRLPCFIVHCHTLTELVLVNVFMASCATELVEMIERHL